ncbi:MAG: pyridoxal 5'-phosphate synthase glutaminase subunit PdxT [Candidatus Dormibacteraeota bacterium]|nr:pyridoxal 5'-phosphate synthase glutaminase subunit PdxT [Candidatus Dormibacteraeota bacterium]
MTITTVGVLALQGDVREHLAAFRRCGVDAVPVRLAAEIESVDALAVPGGESTTMGKLLRAFALEDTLRRRLADGLPTLTTCAGLILLSRSIVDGRPDQVATGTLDIAVRRNGWGSQVNSFEADMRFQGLGNLLFRGVFIRAPRIEKVGADVEVLARLREEPVAVRQGANIGLTFHPEMTGDDRIHRLFLEQVDAARNENAA